jgi:uncharacterized protein YecE (DUF72 family)
MGLHGLGRCGAQRRLLARFGRSGALFLGTSAFTANGWPGSFYPVGMKPSEYLSFYATKFRTVEIDSTYCATPSAATVDGWYRVQDRVRLLSASAYLLQEIPQESSPKFVVEIRNRGWLGESFLDCCANNVALALTDTSFVPRPWELKKPLDLITSDFAYIRWLGNRKQIETMTTLWDKGKYKRQASSASGFCSILLTRTYLRSQTQRRYGDRPTLVLYRLAIHASVR